MRQIFGASWLTSALGYGLAILTEVDLYLKHGSALPVDAAGWVQMMMGLSFAVLGRMTRQTNVTSEQEGAK